MTEDDLLILKQIADRGQYLVDLCSEAAQHWRSSVKKDETAHILRREVGKLVDLLTQFEGMER